MTVSYLHTAKNICMYVANYHTSASIANACSQMREQIQCSLAHSTRFNAYLAGMHFLHTIMYNYVATYQSRLLLVSRSASKCIIATAGIKKICMHIVFKLYSYKTSCSQYWCIIDTELALLFLAISS